MIKLYLFLAILSVPLTAHAHGLVTTQSHVVGDFLVEFEYNTIGSLYSGDYTLYNVFLGKPGTLEGIDFDSAFVRMSEKSGAVVLVANLAQSSEIPGYASVGGNISSPGVYTAEVSFYKDSKSLATSKFDFNVTENAFSKNSQKTNSKYLFTYLFLSGLAVGVIGTYLLKSRSKS